MLSCGVIICVVAWYPYYISFDVIIFLPLQYGAYFNAILVDERVPLRLLELLEMHTTNELSEAFHSSCRIILRSLLSGVYSNFTAIQVCAYHRGIENLFSSGSGSTIIPLCEVSFGFRTLERMGLDCYVRKLLAAGTFFIRILILIFCYFVVYIYFLFFVALLPTADKLLMLEKNLVPGVMVYSALPTTTIPLDLFLSALVKGEKTPEKQAKHISDLLTQHAVISPALVFSCSPFFAILFSFSPPTSHNLHKQGHF
jgi:hypothetical protein